MLDRMGSKERAVDRGSRIASGIIVSIGGEIRVARLMAGLSLAEVGRAVGLSYSQVGRIERARHPSVSVAQLARICSVVGLELAARAYPRGTPIRDRAHLALQARLRAALPPGTRIRSEVPLPLPGDLRAWDMVIHGAGYRIAVEAETRLVDVQALERRIALKARDSGMTRIILLVADTQTNRIALREGAAALSASFPVPGRRAMAALRAGRDPGGSSIVMC